MEKLAKFPIVIQQYFQLTKPGILLGNAVNAAVGIVLAAKGTFSAALFWGTLIGLCCVMASACAYNNVIDRECDKKMSRTRQRVLAQGLTSVKEALIVASFLGVFGFFFLAFFANRFTVFVALMGFIIYVALYSFMKYRSHHATLIGSFAGATPPLVGYCAVKGSVDGEALLLFMLIGLWQMPHFFAIAIYRLEEYAAADIPVLPLKKGLSVTKIQMLLYTIAFVLISGFFTFLGYAGYTHLIVTVLLGGGWIVLAYQGWHCSNHKQWARKMFVFSLIVVMAFCITIPFSAR